MIARRVIIFANPGSGRGRGHVIVSQLEPALTAAGYDVSVHTQHPSAVSDWFPAREAHAAIVVGGDGTLRVVVEQLLTHVGPDAMPPILFIGLGTANLMQAHLELRYSSQRMAHTVLDLLHRRRVRHVDIATANQHVFLIVASCGFGATVVHALTRVRTGPIRKRSYVLPILSTLRDIDFVPLTVFIDDHRVHADRPALVFVGNVREYGTGFPVLDRADSSDRLLDVCVLPCDSVPMLIQTALLTSVGRHHDLPGVVYARATQVRIQSHRPVALQIDGDAAGFTPVDIRLLDARVGFIVA